MAPQIVVQLTDFDLFGNDAAEDETEDVFRSYVLERPEVAQFEASDKQLSVVRAYKGEGKSALLRLTELRIRDGLPAGGIVVSRTGAELAPDFTSDEYQGCTKAWKAAIFGLLANEIGARIGKAWTDDTMTLVEEAQRNGFRSKSFVTAITDRLQGDIKISGAVVPKPVRPDASPRVLAGAVKRRAAGAGAPIWLFVDDIDKNFENTRTQSTRVSSFFDAARELAREVPELRIRAAVRPNVWTTIKMLFESLAKVEQYVVDLHWTEGDCRALLARRVEGYLRRKGLWAGVDRRLPAPGSDREAYLCGFVFDTHMQWGGPSFRPAHVIVYTLSKHRPRWMIELSKGAAKRAEGAHRIRISKDDLVQDLTSFGDRRIQDTIAEFRSQCSEIEELVSAFGRAREQMSTDELLRLIENRILNHVDVHISGVSGRPKALQVASFLYEIGFFYGRREHEDGSYEHVTYADRPALLRSRSNIDDGLAWEIHPVYRQALEMRDSAGKEVRRDPRPPRKRPR